MIVISIAFVFGLILGISEIVGLFKAMLENEINMETILPRIEGIAFAGTSLALCFCGWHDAAQLADANYRNDNDEDIEKSFSVSFDKKKNDDSQPTI